MKTQSLPIEVITTTWEQDEITLRAIRESVFIKEQKVAPDLEWDEHDTSSIHFLALNDQHEPVGVARLMPSGQLGRMAVLTEFRHQGFGSALMRKALKEAQHLGLNEVTLYAQTHAVNFYERFGFKAYDDEFMDAGIPHRRMRIDIEPLNKTEAPTHKGLPDLTQADTFVLGKTTTSFLLNSSQEFKTILHYALNQTRHSIHILTADMDYALLSDETTVQLISRILTSNARAYCKILTHNSDQLREKSHLLIPLARKLTSSLNIKKCNPKYASPNAVYIMLDQSALLFRPSFETFDGFANAHHPRKCRELSHDFDYLWEHALIEDELRTFQL